MARSSIPNALQMRRLKYGEATDAERAAVARQLRAQGRHAEILLLLERHPDPDAMAEEKRWALEQGSSFHLLSLARIGTAVSMDEYRACAEAAERRGRWRDAIQCHRARKDEAAVERVRAILDTEEGREAPASSADDAPTQEPAAS